MPFFDQLTGRLVGYFCLALLFLPKINLIKFEGRETAGLRIDDLVLFCFGFLFLWSRLSLRRSTFDLEKVMGAIAVLSLFSFFCNRLFVALGLLHVDANILYALRPLEYFLFFYIGLIASAHCRPTSLIYGYFILNAILIVLQKAGLAGGFTNYGYEPNVTDRPPGLASFPSEMGVLLNMMFCYIVYRDDKEMMRPIPYLPKTVDKIMRGDYPFALFLVVGLLIVLTGSRIAIFAHIIAFIPFLIGMFRGESPFKLLMLSFLAVFCVGLLGYSIEKISGLVERSQGLLSWRNIGLIGEVWQHIDVDYVPTGHEIVDRAGEDESWWIRIHKWMYGLKIYLSHPECYLQGVGPGFAMAALDGGFMRLLVEQGVLGLALFMRFITLIAAQSRALFWTVVCFAINMIFFDVYLAYKPMTLLLLMTGFAYSQKFADNLMQRRA